VTKDRDLSIFFYLLIGVSCALLLSFVALLPVINRAKKKKEEALKLFLKKKIDK
jgi:uncharacterized membrane protein YgaE (UPF0421/DUF939 family)